MKSSHPQSKITAILVKFCFYQSPFYICPQAADWLSLISRSIPIGSHSVGGLNHVHALTSYCTGATEAHSNLF
jgi:hypothetical protein